MGKDSVFLLPSCFCFSPSCSCCPVLANQTKSCRQPTYFHLAALLPPCSCTWCFLPCLLLLKLAGLLSVGLLWSSLSLLLPPCSLALAPCFLLCLLASLWLLQFAPFLPLADCNVFSDALPLAVGGVGGYVLVGLHRHRHKRAFQKGYPVPAD